MMYFARLRFSILKFLFILLIISSCQSDKNKVSHQADPRSLQEAMVRTNQSMVRMEDERIRAYISRYGWPMKKTGTGLYYLLYSKGHGRLPETGDRVTLEYSVKLLTGNELYNSQTDGTLKAVLGKGQIISGLEEGIFLMRVGDKAKFIIPSHLAYGLLGDQKRIPQKATLLYDVSLVSLQK